MAPLQNTQRVMNGIAVVALESRPIASPTQKKNKKNREYSMCGR